MSKADTLVVLINLGTPNAPKYEKVRKYLTQFLNDPRVIDIPWFGRKILVNGIIVPFRTRKATRLYQEIWTKEGSPLLVYGEKLRDKLQQQYAENVDVVLAMRYQSPGLKEVLNPLEFANYKRIVFFPLFPHYAASSSGSALEEAMKVVSKWWVIPECVFIGQYFDHPGYQKALKSTVDSFVLDEYDHVLFSYHGLPERQLDKTYEGNALCANQYCEETYNRKNRFCYKATCYETTRLLVDKLQLSKEKYTTCFQSRLNDKWVEPFTDEVIINLAKKGAKRLLVLAPAFTADCLETTLEIGKEYHDLFRLHGGEKVELVPSLNDSDAWVSGIQEILSQYV